MGGRAMANATAGPSPAASDTAARPRRPPPPPGLERARSCLGAELGWVDRAPSRPRAARAPGCGAALRKTRGGARADIDDLKNKKAEKL